MTIGMLLEPSKSPPLFSSAETKGINILYMSWTSSES